ncbi:MAG: zinc-ribbon domain-containing protein [Planctomycetes bacterium]|nr:zinc-ribbon domain-containing protein [Planctomycetota bacterium]
MSTSAESARRSPPKIEFACSCGKRYRVPASKAGKKVRCRACRLKTRVPGDAAISLRTRKAILDELGIDPDAAEKAYEQEQVQGYSCARCAASLTEEELPGAYGEEGLVCASCRAAEVEQRGEHDEERKKKDKRLQTWSKQGSVDAAKKKAWAYSALFFAGTAGFVHSFFAPALVVSLGVGALVAAAGGRAIFAAYEPTPEPPRKKA